MALVLRLARHGQKKRPFYRIVATEKSSRRDGKFLEIVGTYNPLTEPPFVNLKEDRIQKYIDIGAKPSETVRNILKKNLPDSYEVKLAAQRAKIQAARKKRKERAAKK